MMNIRTGTDERLTGRLRWAEGPDRGVCKLQQEWEVTRYYPIEGSLPAVTQEWRDVPVVVYHS